jgi:hypothetical protein
MTLQGMLDGLPGDLKEVGLAEEAAMIVLIIERRDTGIFGIARAADNAHKYVKK